MDKNRVIRAADDGAVQAIYQLGLRVGHERGFDAGRSTLSRIWFLWVWLISVIAAMVGGMFLGMAML